MRAALTRRLIRSTGAGGRQDPNLAAIAKGRKPEGGADLHDTEVFGMFRCREPHRTRNIHHEEDGNLPFLEMALQIDFLHTRRNVPVDAPEIFTGFVFAVRLEFIAGTFERTSALAEAQAANAPAHIDFQVSKLFG